MLISTFPKGISEMKLKRRKKNKVEMGVSLGLKRAEKAVDQWLRGRIILVVRHQSSFSICRVCQRIEYPFRRDPKGGRSNLPTRTKR